MLATKNRGGCYATLCVALAVIVAGCTPAGPRALLDGKRLLDEGRYAQAVEKFSIATSRLYTNAHAWNYLGLAYHRAGQPTNAAVAYQKALDLNRDLLEARYNLGCLWLDYNKLELAKAEFTSYTLRRGNASEGWLKLGAAQLRAREPVAAEKSFREVLRVSQGNVEALNGLGLAQLQRNRPRDAVQYLNTALKQQPGYRPALLNLAVTSHQYLNDRPGALQRYREYLALKPRPADWEAVNAVAQVLEQQLTAPSRPPPTNVVAVASTGAATNQTKPTTGTVVHTPLAKIEVPARKVEAPPPVKTEPQTPVAKPVVTSPSTQTSAVEVVTLPPEPVIKTAPDALAVTSTVKETPITQPPPAISTLVVPKEDPTPEKQGFLSRLNPANDSGGSQTAIDTNSIGLPGATAGAPSGQRYAYLSPPKPAAGNRREAERAFAQGQQAQRANRLREAAQAYRQATQTDPSYFEAHYNLGLVAFESRNFQLSLATWENALAIQPESVDARYNFALALKAANYPADAANELKQILADNGNETRAHLVLGNLCAGQFGNPAQARAHYLKVLEQDTRHPQATAIRFWLVAHPP